MHSNKVQEQQQNGYSKRLHHTTPETQKRETHAAQLTPNEDTGKPQRNAQHKTNNRVEARNCDQIITRWFHASAFDQMVRSREG